jgi:DNA-binding MarR family transcriptional regulator
VSAGLAVREPDPEDRRYLSIALTEDGQKLFNEIEESMDAHFDDIFVHVPEEKRKVVLENLILVIEAVDKSGALPA